MNKDYYQILGVERNASESEIKSAYRKLAMEHHPDKGGSEDKFKEISDAYSVLSDPEKKRQFDQFGAIGNQHQGGGFSGFGFGDIFGGSDFFSRGFNGNRGHNVKKGQNVRIKIRLTLDEILKGTKKKVRLNRQVTCDICNGTGSKDDKTTTCSTCNGAGFVLSIQNTPFGQMKSKSTCPSCHGEGKIIKDKCTTCNGQGTKPKDDIIELEIPYGVIDGMTLSMNGKGNECPGGINGDLMILIEEIQHSKFKRIDYDLYYNLKISIPDAILGKSVEIDTLENRIRINVDPSTPSGKILKIKGKGIPQFNSNMRGDLLVKVEIHIPQRLNKEEKIIIEKLRESENFKNF